MLDEADYQQSIADVFEAVEESLSLTKLHSESNKQQMCYQTNKKNSTITKTMHSTAYNLKILLILGHVPFNNNGPKNLSLSVTVIP